jgi:hypothetical protein
MSRPLHVNSLGMLASDVNAGLDSLIEAGAVPTRIGVVTERVGPGCDAVLAARGLGEEPPQAPSRSSAPTAARISFTPA